MKRPAFQFYPADWRKDSALQSCSLTAQGLWVNMLCIAHECDPYGHLSVNGRPMTAEQLARLVGLSGKECGKLLRELEDAGVFSRTEQGEVYSRRMVADERIRNIRSEAGKLGGNPNLLGDKVKQKVNQADNQSPKQDDKQSPTPSSSSSSSSSEKTKERASPTGSRLALDSLPAEWYEFAMQENPNADPSLTFAKFSDHWKAQPGAKGRKADWEATWRNWVRREKEFIPRGQTAPDYSAVFAKYQD